MALVPSLMLDSFLVYFQGITQPDPEIIPPRG